MPRFSPRTWIVCASFVSLSASVGCGRFGFDHVPLDRAAARPDGDGVGSTGDANAEGGAGSSTDASMGDDGTSSATDGGVNGSADGGDNTNGSADGDAGPSTGTLDAGGPAQDAALPLPDLEPYPDDIICSSFTGLIACDSLTGSASGVSVDTSSYGTGAEAMTDQVFSGFTTGDSSSADLVASFNPIMSGALYLRFSAFVPSSFAISGINLASLGNLSDTGDFGVDLNLVSNGKVEIKTSGDGVVSSAGNYMLPRDQWLCMLLKLESIDSSTGAVSLWIDDTQRISATDVDTAPPGGVQAATAGIDWTFFNQGPARVYIDNFVLARDHPGSCP